MGEFQQLGDNESQPKRGGQEVGRGLEQGDTDFLHRADESWILWQRPSCSSLD